MANKSVPASSPQPIELAITEHWLTSAWRDSKLNIGLQLALRSADRASKGASAVAGVLHRDFLARIDLADSQGGLTYPLLEPDEHDRLFVALQSLIEATERELDRIREDSGGLASSALQGKANG